MEETIKSHASTGYVVCYHQCHLCYYLSEPDTYTYREVFSPDFLHYHPSTLAEGSVQQSLCMPHQHHTQTDTMLVHERLNTERAVGEGGGGRYQRQGSY